MIKDPVAYCKSHKCYLSKKQMKVHRCLSRGCTGLQKMDCPYWEERKQRKESAKKKRKEIYSNAIKKGGKDYGKEG